MGVQGYSECGEFRKVLERPQHSRIRNGNLEGGTMSHTLETQTAVTVPEGPAISPLAGKPAPKEMLIDVARLEKQYFERKPDASDRNQLVAFGTSGHRGSPLHGTFTEAHILAITQAICEYRKGQGIDGPLYMGKDTHALSAPAQRTALEVLAANGDSAWVSFPIYKGPSIPCPLRYSQIACVIARMCASLKAPCSEDPRYPLVPKATSWFRSLTS